LINAASSNGRCNTVWYKAVFKGGVYEARETVWVFGGAETRGVASLEGRTDAAGDRARFWQRTFLHSLSGVASRWDCSGRPAACAPRGLASGSSIREPFRFFGVSLLLIGAKEDFRLKFATSFLYSQSRKEPMMIPKPWSERDHPFNRKFGRAQGVTDWTELYRNHVQFGKSKDSTGLQIADIAANICYRHFSGKPKNRPYRLLRSRISGGYNSEIHYGVLNELSLLTDSPENHVSDYSEKEHAAMAEIKAKRVGSQGAG